MVTYSYRCAHCGVFDVRTPMGQATRERPCPACGTPAVRRFTAPALRRGPNALTRAVDDAERSAERPEVVSGVPARRGRVSRDPRHAGLPRP